MTGVWPTHPNFLDLIESVITEVTRHFFSVSSYWHSIRVVAHRVWKSHESHYIFSVVFLNLEIPIREQKQCASESHVVSAFTWQAGQLLSGILFWSLI
jgi:hypothetical protein